MLDMYYTHQENNGAKSVNFSKKNLTYDESLLVIDNSPWRENFKWFREKKEGRGLYFKKSSENGVQAYLQFVPIEEGRGLLFLEIQLKRGLWGRKTKSIDFEMVTTGELKEKVKELFYYGIYTLYEKYEREGR
jgi:hypothetical protein